MCQSQFVVNSIWKGRVYFIGPLNPNAYVKMFSDFYKNFKLLNKTFKYKVTQGDILSLACFYSNDR